MLQYFGLVAAAFAFEFTYVAWGRAVAADQVGRTVAYSVAVAGLSLLGLKGALQLQLGWIAYLAGIALGAWASAYLGSRGLVNTARYAWSKLSSRGA